MLEKIMELIKNWPIEKLLKLLDALRDDRGMQV